MALQINPLVDFAIALRLFLGPWAQPPLSAVTVLLVSSTVALASNLINRHFIDYEKLRRSRTEIQKWQDMKKEAEKETDPRLKRKLLLKVKRRQRYITKLQGEVGKQSLLPMAVTFVPFILIYAIMNGVFFNDTLVPGVPVLGPVIWSPFNFAQLLGTFGLGLGWQYGSFPGVPPGGQGLFYIVWYIITSFTVNQILQKFLRTSMT